MPIEAMDQRLDRWLVEVPNVAGGLPGFLPQHHGLGVYKPAAKQGFRLQSTLSLACHRSLAEKLKA